MTDNKLPDELKSIGQNIKEILVEQARMGENLKEHMRRTEMAEEAIKHLSEVLVPITRHVSNVEGILKFLGLLSVVATIVLSIVQLFFMG